MTRVLHVGVGNLYGGVETYLVTIAKLRGLCSEMQPEFAVCFRGRLFDELERTRAPLHELGEMRASHPSTVVRARARLATLLDTGRFDAVVFHMAWAHGLLGGAVRGRVKSVVHMHGPRAHDWNEWLSQRVPTDLVLTPSHHTSADWRSLFPRAKHEVLPNPLPSKMTDMPPPSPADRARMRSEVGAGADDLVILHAARMQAWKGPDRTLRAVVGLKDLPGWRLWIAGAAQRPEEEALDAELRRTIAELGLSERVSMLGDRADVPQLMYAADIYCQANRGAEGYGLSLLEAAYAGLPVVTTALGPASEVIDPDGGILVPFSEDVAPFTAALRTLLTDGAKRRRMGERGRIHARTFGDPARQLLRLSSLLSASQSKAEMTGGMSNTLVIEMVARTIERNDLRGALLIDIGGGRADLRPHVAHRFDRYVVADAMRHRGLPPDVEFVAVDLDRERLPFPNGSADAVTAVEVIEHLENPRALMREMTRLVRPGGSLLVTTPNQLSVLNKISFAVRNEHAAFRGQDAAVHISALLEADLRRIAVECGWRNIEVAYSGRGRFPGSDAEWPSWLSRKFSRGFSDNVLIVGTKAEGANEAASARRRV